MRMGLAVAAMAGGIAVAQAAFSVPVTHAAPVDVNIQLSGYLPAPPGVRIHFEAGRPYYVENHRRVYVERDPKHDRGRHRGHYKEEEHDRKKGHGKGHGHD